MPHLYIYSPTDFVTPPPDEVSAAAGGTPVFTLTLKPGATPTLVEINDNDTIFDEVDSSQKLASDVTIDGVTYTAGTSINTAYDLLSNSGHKVTSLHFGGTGYQQGPVDGIVSTVELVPGQSYSFQSERTSHQENNPYAEYFACFVTGTRITTSAGEVAVENLVEGDLVLTMDHGLKPVSQILSTTVIAEGKFAPVVFPKGALGNSEPLSVSQQHRMLLRTPNCELLFGESEIFVPAIHLAQAGLGKLHPGGLVTYYHVVFDQHEVIYSNGAETESFLPYAMEDMPDAAGDEAVGFFPHLSSKMPKMQASRQCLRSYETRALMAA